MCACALVGQGAPVVRGGDVVPASRAHLPHTASAPPSLHPAPPNFCAKLLHASSQRAEPLHVDVESLTHTVSNCNLVHLRIIIRILCSLARERETVDIGTNTVVAHQLLSSERLGQCDRQTFPTRDFCHFAFGVRCRRSFWNKLHSLLRIKYIVLYGSRVAAVAGQ